MAATDEQDEQPATPKSSPLKKILGWTLVLALVVGGGTAGALYYTGGLQSAKGEQESSGGHAETESGGGHGNSQDVVYHAFEPPFVVNFRDQDVIRFLQIGVEVMAEDKSVIKAVKQHDAVIRNNLLLLFSSQSFEDISTRQGKEKLRQAALAEVRDVLEERTGDPGVQQVYFTRFVMQ